MSVSVLQRLQEKGSEEVNFVSSRFLDCLDEDAGEEMTAV